MGPTKKMLGVWIIAHIGPRPTAAVDSDNVKAADASYLLYSTVAQWCYRAASLLGYATMWGGPLFAKMLVPHVSRS